ncbi:MAG: lysophospholipid acyltransferase family protein [Planctomycetaceae bacterium]|nr:lysophospholipid acyltransferase family protein [Planctomycetaceae bacterium]
MKIRSRWLIRLLARTAAVGFRSLFATTHKEIITDRPETSPYVDSGEQKFLYCIWHDSILGPIFGGRCVKMAALTSLHGDGAYVADAIECVGITPIRGSSSRGGAAAVQKMLEAARDMDISIATDGPRGPRRQVKVGIVYLASQTGRPIVPVAFSARRSWSPRGRWTDALIPKPFTRIWLLGGEPIKVPPDLTRDDLKEYRDRVQEAMDALSAQADRYSGRSSSEFEVASRRAADVRRAA